MWGIREPFIVRDALASGRRLPHPLEVEGESVIWFAVPTLSELTDRGKEATRKFAWPE